MIKKYILTIIFLGLILPLFSQAIPHPKNDRLYTDFTCYRYAAYLKKPIISTGFIAMDGQANFLFKQISPLLIEIRKTGDKIIYKRGDQAPMEFSASSGGAVGTTNSIIFLFDDSGKIKDKYNIVKKSLDGKDEYTVTPKEKEAVKQIFITAVEDRIETIKMYFADNTSYLYEFKNTVTGVKPDEKYFQF
jgi:hypothetical protein